MAPEIVTTIPVLVLLLYYIIVFLGGAHRFRKSPRKWEILSLSGLFFCSGMPALIYQIVWQRVLFSIYGVNAESVAVVVSAFMLGLGLGSLAGGWASSRYPQKAVALFGALELGVAVFGLASPRARARASSGQQQQQRSSACRQPMPVAACRHALLPFLSSRRQKKKKAAAAAV